jgi:hypothetical protein
MPWFVLLRVVTIMWYAWGVTPLAVKQEGQLRDEEVGMIGIYDIWIADDWA